jgi:putative membrane protein
MKRWKIAFGRRGRERQSALFQSLRHCVGELAQQTSASVAVVVRGSSGSYRDVACLCGAGVAWLGLLLILFVPHELHVWAVPLDVLGLFLVAAWLCSRSRLRVWLTTRQRRRGQVRTAAHAAFVEEGVLHARHDQGVLIYWSLLERRVEVVADTGVLRRVPAAEWHVVVFALRAAPRQAQAGTAFVEQLHSLGALLSRHLPATGSPPLPAHLLGGRP